MRRELLISNIGKADGSKANTSDVVFANKKTEELVIATEWNLTLFPSEDWEPIGIVVIPGEHGVLKDGTGTINQCGVMSLVSMFSETPEKGEDSREPYIYWGSKSPDFSNQSDGLGRYDSVTNGLQNYDVVCHVGDCDNHKETIQGTISDAYLPSDIYGMFKNPYDNRTSYLYNYSGYYYIPSPYQNDGSYNPIYGQTASPSSEYNAMSDFKGIVNTKIITDLAKQPDWRTATTIINGTGSYYYPAACCCARFKPTGTKAFVDCSNDDLKKGYGFWYLPACGELGYIIPRLHQINLTISALKSAYGVGIQLDNDGIYWSSSECTSNSARRVGTSNGFVNSYNKANSQYVRAFMRL